MDTELTIQLFFFAAGVPVALEAYKAKGRARIILWSVAVAFGLMGFVWPALSSGWPALVALGAELATNPSAWFAIAVTIFFVLRPYWTAKDPVRAGNEITQTYDDRPLKTELAKLAEDRKAIIDDYQRMSALDGKFQALAAALAGLPEKAEAIRVDVALAIRDIERLDARVAEMRDRNANSFYALWVREETARLEHLIMQDSADLYNRLHAGEPYDQQAWGSWESVHAHWNEALRDWVALARFYVPGDLSSRLFTVEEVEFIGPWSVQDSQFPTGDAIRRFKRHRIIQRHWEEVLDATKRNVQMVAFQGLSIEDACRGALPKQQ